MHFPLYHQRAKADTWLDLYVMLFISKESAVHKLLFVEMSVLFVTFFPLNNPETKLKFSIDFQLNSCQ